jgi:hypothetical protein
MCGDGTGYLREGEGEGGNAGGARREMRGRAGRRVREEREQAKVVAAHRHLRGDDVRDTLEQG